MNSILSKIIPSSVLGVFARNQLYLDHNPYDPYIIKVADNQSELDSAFKLIYDHHDAGLKLTPYHALPTTSVIIFVKDNVVCGTTTVVKDSTFGLPIENHVDLRPLRKHQRLAEITSFAMAPEYQKESGRYLFLMMKFLFTYIEEFMSTDTILVSAHPSMRIFYDEILYFDTFPKVLLKGHEEPENILRMGYLPELHNRWQQKYLGKSKESNLSYFFDVYKEDKFIFPNRIYYKDHDPVLTKDMMGHFFMKMDSVLKDLTLNEKHKLLHFYYMTPFFEPLKKHFNITEDIQFPRKNLRHDVRNLGTLVQGKWKNLNYTKVLNVSKEGLSIQVSDATERLILKHERNIQLSMKIGLGRTALLKIEPIHGDKEKSIIGCRILDAEPDWEKYIDFLNSDLMKDVFHKKVV